jgi:G3E family GTPase
MEDDAMERAPAIPVTIVAGYLGAGKTTLVNHLLRNADGLRLAVLVNDFGELPIDADLIVGGEGDVLAIAGGCICCSFGSDLVGTLQDVARMQPPPDHLLVETSGVALPAPVAATLSLVAGLALEAVVVLADAETVMRYGRDRYLADTIAAQLAAADLIVLNKCDLVAADRQAELEQWLAAAAPAARIVPAARGKVPPAVLLGLDKPRMRSSPAGTAAVGLDLGPAPLSYETCVFEFADGQEPRALAEGLAAPRSGLLRAKGHMADGHGQVWTLQVVGSRFEVSPGPATVAEKGRIVCIGLKGRLDHEYLRKLCAPR